MTAGPGTYALVLSSDIERSIVIGRLGELDVCPGFYVYVGSARGPGGLQARVARHCRASKRRHWHIDHLSAVASVEEVWYSENASGVEHQWAAAIAGMPGASVALAGFGSSDCHCRSHLFRFASRPRVQAFRRSLGDAQRAEVRICGAI